jgi:hypothetical protein
MNHTAEKALNGRTPEEVLTGRTPDISFLFCFMFWDKVHVERYPSKSYQGQVGSQKSHEISGRFVGFADNVGHAMTFLILTDDTKRIIARSQVRLAKDKENVIRMTPDDNAPQCDYMRSFNEESDILPTIDTDLIHKEFDIDGGEPTVIETRDTLHSHKPPSRTVNTKPPPQPEVTPNPAASEPGEWTDGEDDSSTTEAPEPPPIPKSKSNRRVPPKRMRNNPRPMRESRKDVDYSTKCADFSPMDKPIKDYPIVEDVSPEDEELGEHHHYRAPGEDNPLGTPLNF